MSTDIGQRSHRATFNIHVQQNPIYKQMLLLHVFVVGEGMILLVGCFDVLTNTIQTNLCICCHIIAMGITSATVAVKLLDQYQYLVLNC